MFPISADCLDDEGRRGEWKRENILKYEFYFLQQYIRKLKYTCATLSRVSFCFPMVKGRGNKLSLSGWSNAERKEAEVSKTLITALPILPDNRTNVFEDLGKGMVGVGKRGQQKYRIGS